MPSSDPVWLFLKCPECGTVAKTSPNIQADALECAGCHAPIPVETAERVDPAFLSTTAVSALSHLPTARTVAPEGASVRGKEEWERGAQEKTFDLKGRLRSVEDESLKPDPDNPVMKRRSHRKDRKARQMSDFEQEEEGLAVTPRKRRTRSRRAAKLMPWLIGAIVVLVVVVAVLTIRQLFPGTPPPVVEMKPKRPQQGTPPAEVLTRAPGSGAADPLDMDKDSLQEHMPGMTKAIDGVASAKTVEEMLPFIRDSERLAPVVKSYYTGERAWKPIQLRPYSYDRVAVDGRFASILLETLNFEPLVLAVERTPSGFLVDWEAWTAHGDMTWEDFVAKPPAEPVLMRAILSAGPPDSSRLFYGGKFTEAEYLCLEIADAERYHVIFGYAPRLSQTAQDLAAAAADQPVDPLNGMVSFRGIVKLRYPPGAEDKTQVEIEELIERGWVYRPDRGVR